MLFHPKINHLFSSLLVILFIVSCHSVMAQQKLDVRVNNVKEGSPVIDFFETIGQDHNLKFFYLEEWLQHFKMRPEFEGKTLNEMLQLLLRDSDVKYVFLYDYAVIFFKDPARDLKRDELIISAITKKIKVDEVIIGNPSQFDPGKKITIQGKVFDERNGAGLSGVLININELGIHSATDERGQYKFILPQGRYAIGFNQFNYEEKLLDVSLYDNGQLNVEMSENPITLQEVVISDQVITNMRISQSSIKMTELKRVPAFLGIPDIIKQIQTQAGVSTVSEASSGFNVRGGGTDQNLILFDGVPVFNTVHALGFFTAFNTESINQATFYKGGIPAEFGGRVSSVLNLISKEGDYDKWGGSGGIGLITSDLTLGGPVKKDTSSLIFSFRSSYSDWVLNLLKTRFREIQNGSVFFYDGSLKYTHKINSNNKFTFSAYASHDEFALANDTINQWQTLATSLRYDHTANNNISYSIGLSLGQYGYRVTENDPPTAFNLNYKITYPAFKIDFNQEGLLHKRSFGFHTTFYDFQPGELLPASENSNVVPAIMPHERSSEMAVYFNETFNWTEHLSVDAGLRVSLYTRLGSATSYQYRAGEPREPKNTIDSTVYNAGEIVKMYVGPEPRLSLRYMLNQQSSLKLGFNRMYQYVHLISNTASATPVDIWQMSDDYFRPQRCDLISIGYFRNWQKKNNDYEASIEGFYKNIKNILDFKDGANLILNPQLETALLNGISKAYGIELAVSKFKGRLLGGVNYTYSRSFRKVDGAFSSETINEGAWYPSNYDQPHIVNLNWRYNLTRKVFFTGTFTYHTGRPVSLPRGAYMIDNTVVSDFSERNNYRIPDYHRLDIALVIEGSNRIKKSWEGNWTISIYNVYGRKNPYSVFFSNAGGGVLKPYRLSLIGTAVPSVTYRFKF